MRKIHALLLIAALSLPGAAEDREASDFDRFQLWSECRPLELVVEGLHNAAADIGLEENRIETMARSRLRAARLYSDTPQLEYLYILVTVSGPVARLGGYLNRKNDGPPGHQVVWEGYARMTLGA